MTVPVMEPELTAGLLRDWARAIDDGPFSSLCWGERMAFDNPETLTLMGALAAWIVFGWRGELYRFQVSKSYRGSAPQKVLARGPQKRYLNLPGRHR